MFCAMLEVNPKSDQVDNYFGMAKMLRPELEKIDGFVDNDRFASLSRPGWLLSLSSWRDEKSLVRWSVETHHHKVMQAARDWVFADYRMHIGEFVADTRVPMCAASTVRRSCAFSPRWTASLEQAKVM
jgi:heme-degrading monooxygenase HmoA